MNISFKLHKIQLHLLNSLSKKKSLRFNQLLIEGLESEHMNYHLKKLMEYGLVEKKGNKYSLTIEGKDHVNLMDDTVEQIEKQPKTSVLIHAVRINKKTGEVEHLLSKRTKQPYLGKVGRLTGKVRFGEMLEEAVIRELYEETGLETDKPVLEQIYHKLRYNKAGVVVQDVLFYRFFVFDPQGKLIEKTPYQENFWISRSNLEKSDIDVFDDLNLTDRSKVLGLHFTEEKGMEDGF